MILYSILFYLVFGRMDLIPPPGTVKTGENRFVDRQLMTYIGYYEFLDWLDRNKQHEKYLLMLPKDTTIQYGNKRMWRNARFEEYPIAGLERSQIEEYCKWRSDIVNIKKNGPKDKACNYDYWIQFETMDPGYELKITYTLAEQRDLEHYDAPKEKYWLPEYTREGTYPRAVSKKVAGSDRHVFRCVAFYEKVNQ